MQLSPEKILFKVTVLGVKNFDLDLMLNLQTTRKQNTDYTKIKFIDTAANIYALSS